MTPLECCVLPPSRSCSPVLSYPKHLFAVVLCWHLPLSAARWGTLQLDLRAVENRTQCCCGSFPACSWPPWAPKFAQDCLWPSRMMLTCALSARLLFCLAARHGTYSGTTHGHTGTGLPSSLCVLPRLPPALYAVPTPFSAAMGALPTAGHFSFEAQQRQVVTWFTWLE